MVSDVFKLNLVIVGEYDVDQVKQIPVYKLCQVGFVALWMTNFKLQGKIHILKTWGYCSVEVVVWVKKTRSGKLCYSHGQFLRHNKEILLLSVRKNLFYLNLEVEI
eukprot:snap_masked-scaffold_66-processed-gene-0.40-mRNA-1 protein AED:1.00 eAED:1.00 QI:0/0/0/0/1/1/2/0/105